jgi:putative membrane protein
MGGMMAGWALLWLVLIVVGVVIILYVVIRLTGNGIRRPRGEGQLEAASAARRILDERFARGEIDAEEYQRRRDLLR